METEALHHKKCVPCEGGATPLSDAEIKNYLAAVAGWSLEEGKLVREYAFKNFAEALAFVNRVGELAESEGHHPDLNLYNWNKVKITLYTHAINGLHLNDFVLASKINLL